MLEATSLEGYTPERLGDAIGMMAETESQMLVFRGMATQTHDCIVAMHTSNVGKQGDRSYQAVVDSALRDLGWDVDVIADLSPETSASNNLADLITYELVLPGVGIDMHHDVTRSSVPHGLFIPRGFGVSINLVEKALFEVEENSRHLELPDIMTKEDSKRLTDGASNLSGEVTEVVSSTVMPGDVVLWRQPQAHKVAVYSPSRRAVTIIREDHYEVGDIVLYR